MNGHCLVCDAARANGTTDEHLGRIATASIEKDAAGKPTRPTRSPVKIITDVPDYIPEKYRARIGHWDDERALGHSLIVSLKKGWRWPVEEGSHVCGFDTVDEARAAIRQTMPCSCPLCNAHGQDSR